MKYLFEYLRLTFISLEFLYVLLVVAVVQYFPSLLAELGSTIRSDTDVLKWIPVLPLAMCGIVFRLAWRLTAPLSGSNRLLYDWSEYWRLKCRRDFSVVLSAIVAIAAVSLWIFSGKLSNSVFGTVFTLAIGIGLIDMACLAFAGFKIKELVEQ